MSEELAVGIVGCGGTGGSHAQIYRGDERTRIAAAADASPSTLEEFADEFDIDATYNGHDDMLGSEDLDVVSVCTWHSTHAEITVEAAEAGVGGVLCEKPMATSLGEAEDMLEAAKRNGTKLVINHQRRFDPVHERARELVAEGVIGEPRSVTAGRDSGLLNWGTHMIDLTRFILGDPDHAWVMGQVERRTDRHERGEPIEDRCLAHVCFADGARFTYESDLPAPDRSAPSIQLTGSEGVLTVDLGSSVSVVTSDGSAEYAPTAEQGELAASVDAFLEWLDGSRDGHRCRGATAQATLEIMMSVYESARTNAVVSSPLATRANPLKAMIGSGALPVEYPGRYDIRLPYGSVRGPNG